MLLPYILHHYQAWSFSEDFLFLRFILVFLKKYLHTVHLYSAITQLQTNYIWLHFFTFWVLEMYTDVFKSNIVVKSHLVLSKSSHFSTFFFFSSVLQSSVVVISRFNFFLMMLYKIFKRYFSFPPFSGLSRRSLI